MSKQLGYSAEGRVCAVRLMHSSEYKLSFRWAAKQSAASKIDCAPETLGKEVIALDLCVTEEFLKRCIACA